MEFGKDFTFSYINPLNQRVNVGLQAKWGDIKGSSKALIGEIVNQSITAFKVPYKNKPNDQELFLNELYIVCSGEYKNNAITIIERALDKNYNVHFLDGSDIVTLRNKLTTRKTNEKIVTKRALNALLIELDQNIKTAKEIDRDMEEYIQKEKHFLIGYRLNCLEKMLELDIDDKWMLDEALIQWRNLTIDNTLINQILLVLSGSKWKEEKKNVLWNNVKKDIEGLANFREYVASYLESLQ